jgi:hypothetical protein
VTEQEKRDQVAKQCRVVAHLAKALADVHEDYVTLLEDGGAASARRGRCPDGRVHGDPRRDDDDDWTAPVFVKAQRLWPKTP